MPLTTTDITVPVVRRDREHYGMDYYCELCDEAVGTDYHFQPEPHRLNECLARMKERIAKLEGAG